ncbi:MAG: hypothetical protein DME85_11005 [Verrucomicrobia bacterium]|nr:MAG: hypothetical protein DME85_11005 [Verrucomicrobiota bacterium]
MLFVICPIGVAADTAAATEGKLRLKNDRRHRVMLGMTQCGHAEVRHELHESLRIALEIYLQIRVSS